MVFAGGVAEGERRRREGLDCTGHELGAVSACKQSTRTMCACEHLAASYARERRLPRPCTNNVQPLWRAVASAALALYVFDELHKSNVCNFELLRRQFWEKGHKSLIPQIL